MAGERKLVVTIVGDDRSLQAALTRSTAATARFGQNVNRNLGGISSIGSFGPLLEDVRRMRAESERLSTDLGDLDKSASGAGSSLAGFVARTTIAGIALTTAFQASRRLTEALKTTGEEAFTTSGRLKNVGASLLQGDIIGGLEALRRTPQTLEELGLSATEAANRIEALSTVAGGQERFLERAAAAGRDNSDAMREWGEVTKEAGTNSQRLAREQVALVASLQAAENAQDALADATARVGSVFRTSTGDVVAFKGAVDDAAGLRGPGLADAINDALEQASAGAGGARPARPIGPTARNANAQIIAAANEDLAEVLRLQQVEEERLRKAVANATGNVKQREALARDYAVAQAAVISTERAIASQADAAARAREQAAEAARREAEANERERKARAKAAAARAAAIREQQQALEQARQFRAIGLSGTGDQPIPTIANLQKQLQQLDKRLISEDVPAKLTNRLAGVRKVLADGIRKAEEPTRAAINDLFNAIRKEFDDEQSKGPLTKTTSLNAGKLLEGLGLGRDLEKELRARLSSFNSAGVALAGNRGPTGSFVVGGEQVVESHVTVELDGEVLASSVTRSQQKAARRNPRQKRGPNRRGGL